MSSNTVEASTQADAASPAQQPATTQQQQQQGTQTQTTQTSQAQTAAVQSPTAPAAPTGANNTYICQWTGCGEPCANAESLYEHVCEKHVGRKSTNNLNLTCSWGNCHTTTVKRDHITSHIRVHVPLKPHKCDLCGKSFKRPQDLKKHVKTHAEDPGSMMRGPHDGAGNSRQQPNGYGHMGPGRLNGYPEYPGMPGNPGVGYGYPGQPGGMGHYAPTAHHGGPGHFGQVYYPAASGIGNHASFDKGNGFNSLDHLFGAIKNRQFDPSNYTEVSQHLMGLQNVQLPLPMNGGGYEHGGNGGGVYGPQTAYHSQNLPSFSNLRTKQDLTFIEDYLNQMTQAAYENSGSMGGGNAIPTGYGMGPRQSNSPPSMAMPPSTHAQDVNMTPGAGNSPPALTPGGSSSMSYTSGQSPTSVHSHVVSPTNSHPSYPTLPNVTDGPNSGMPASTLGNQYDHDLRRRWSGNIQQRAQTARRNSNEMEIDAPEIGESKKKSKSKRDANIDPQLAGGSVSGSSAASDRTVTPPRDGPDQDEAWVENMRLLEKIRAFVRELMENGQYNDEERSSEDRKMSDAKSEGAPEPETKSEKNDEVSYTTLKTE